MPAAFQPEAAIRFQDRVEIIDGERNMDRTDVARPKFARTRSAGARYSSSSILCSRSFKNHDREFSPGTPVTSSGEIPGLMHTVRELEPEDIPPESERPFEVRDGDAGVIGGDDVKRNVGDSTSTSGNVKSLQTDVPSSPRDRGDLALTSHPGSRYLALRSAAMIRSQLTETGEDCDFNETISRTLPDPRLVIWQPGNQD